MKVPILDLVRQYQSIKPEMDAAILRVVASGRFILGPEVEALEQEVATFCGAKAAIAVASGTDALLLSLRALGIGPGDAVLVPSFTFFATAGVVHNVGATPIFCDIDPKTFNLDPASARRILAEHNSAGRACGTWHVARGKAEEGAAASRTASSTSQTPQTKSGFFHRLRATRHRLQIKAIIPVHLYGQMADMDELMEIAAEHKLAVVEDAAQAIGAQYSSRAEHVARSLWPVGDTGPNGENTVPPQATSHMPQAIKAGTMGHLGCFSFFPTKNLGAYGDAGMIVTNDDALAERVRILRVHGSKPKYYHKLIGYNSRLDALQAAILRTKLPHLSRWTAARQRIADRYDKLLSGIDGIETPYRAPDRTHIFHQYTIRVAGGRRHALQKFLKEKEIGTEVYYPLPLHLQECFQNLGTRQGSLPESERASHDVLSLPIFPELKDEEQDYVAQTIRTFK
jgi:dTDP-4-amino-4,6-dideoxygalactose transaminase